MHKGEGIKGSYRVVLIEYSKILCHIFVSTFYVSDGVVVSVFHRKSGRQVYTVFRLQTVFVIQGLVTCSWGVAVIKDIAHLVRITSVLHPQFSPLLKVLCPPPPHLHSTSNIGNQQHYTLTGGP